MSRETVGLRPDLLAYVDAHSEPPTDVQESLIAATSTLGDVSMMQIGRAQGAFTEVLVRALAPGLAVEVGTFTGYSALAIAKGLPADGRLICCDVSTEWTDIARPHWEQAGVADKIELRIGPALDTLRAMPRDIAIDFAFIDADKVSYVDYYEELLARLSPRGLIAVDNTLWSGAVVDAADDSRDTVAIQAFNDHVARDPRTVAALGTIGDGVTLITHR